MFVLLAIVALVATASAKDLIAGHEGGRLIFEQNVTASPAIWRQEQKVTVNASDFEVITRVVVTDNREDKNGEAAVVEGGEGHKNVTIELKSPAIFRGFDFKVQVYAQSEDGQQTVQKPVPNDQQSIQTPINSEDGQQTIQKPVPNDQQSVQTPIGLDTNVNDKQVPKEEVDKVTPVPTSSTTQVPNTQDKVQHPIVAGKGDEQVRPVRGAAGEQTEQKPVNPTLVAKESLQNDKKDEGQTEQSKNLEGQIQTDLDKIFSDPLKPEVQQNKQLNEDEIAKIFGDHSTPNPESKETSTHGKDVTKEADLPPLEVIPVPTEKNVVGQQEQKPVEVPAETQQTKVHVKGLPLPYVNH